MDRLEKAISKIGIQISVQTSDGTKNGMAVFYPVRYQQKSSGNISYTSEGRTDSGRFMMFAVKNLLDEAEYGDIISDGNNQYMLLWTDIYSCSSGSYVKACVKLMTDRSVTDS